MLNKVLIERFSTVQMCYKIKAFRRTINHEEPPSHNAPHLVALVRDSRVVLDLPQTLSEAFPLVCFSKLLFAFFVRKQVLGSEEGAVGKSSG